MWLFLLWGQKIIGFSRKSGDSRFFALKMCDSVPTVPDTLNIYLTGTLTFHLLHASPRRFVPAQRYYQYSRHRDHWDRWPLVDFPWRLRVALYYRYTTDRHTRSLSVMNITGRVPVEGTENHRRCPAVMVLRQSYLGHRALSRKVRKIKNPQIFSKIQWFSALRAKRVTYLDIKEKHSYMIT